MIAWKNLDTTAAYKKLQGLKNHVCLQDAMSGESGAKRVKEYCVPMAGGLSYNYAAKQVDADVLAALKDLRRQTGGRRRAGRAQRFGRRNASHRKIRRPVQRRSDQHR